MKVIKQEIIKELMGNQKAKARLAYEFAKHMKTIDRWLEGQGNHVILTTPAALAAIAEELDIKKSDILTK